MMRFTVANWHRHHNDPQWWVEHNGYTTMTSPPEWAKEANRNLDIFAPTPDIVFGHVSQDHYKAVYRQVLQSRMGDIRAWVAAHDGEHVILLCACPGNSIEERFCHRYLIAKVLTWLGCEEVPLIDEESEPMDDIVVTVPKTFGLDTWIAEGDPAGDPWHGDEWHFYLGEVKPNVQPGARVYVTYNGILRGYAPLVRVEWVPSRSCWALVRHGGAVAVTITGPIPGFRGFRARWWDRSQERPFDAPWYDGRPQWQVAREWERRGCIPNHPSFPTLATHLFALLLDGIPIAGYYKLGKIWHCTRCEESFLNATVAQEHIKSNETHIADAVAGYVARKREQRQAVIA